MQSCCRLPVLFDFSVIVQPLGPVLVTVNPKRLVFDNLEMRLSSHLSMSRIGYCAFEWSADKKQPANPAYYAFNHFGTMRV